MTEQELEAKTASKYLRELIAATRVAIRAIDAEMNKPSTFERGQRIARITNALEFATDSAERFGLGKVKRARRKR